MSTSSDEVRSSNDSKTYKGIRCRRWGKWVSEIRVPGSKERLWLGTYSTPEGAAVAHDVASYCLRGNTCLHKLNFPSMLPNTARTDLSPRSIQKAASDAGMAIDARFIASQGTTQNNVALDISVDDYL
ncbi:ethylene-responsive transcription factor ERF020-like [Bidens hawaiensis]|uniref:ethylene-responsive transcription factor ERF020-like n=1 Tax=Bidens hawaiensis TaxID=980011 RepID=UPI00404A2A73